MSKNIFTTLNELVKTKNEILVCEENRSKIKYIDIAILGLISYMCESKILEKQDDIRSKYNELILQVVIKHPNENRHETALRQITHANSIPNTLPDAMNN